MKWPLMLSVPALFLSSLAWANCPSIDNTLAEAKLGMASSIEVAEAFQCQLGESRLKNSLCQTRIGIKKDVLENVRARFELGQKTRQDIDDAAKALAETESSCP